MEPNLLVRVSAVLYREASLLDERRWDEWLAMYLENCEFWLLAWDSEYELALNPKTDLSLIYYDNRSNLEERVVRIRTGLSAASRPLPRTWHLVSNVRLGEQTEDNLQVFAKWQTHAYRHEQTDTYYGTYEYWLRKQDGEFRIARKKIVLINDVLCTALDIYNI